MAARMVFPLISSVEIRSSSRDKLCGNYVRAEDRAEEKLKEAMDEALKKKNLPPTRVLDHIYLQLQFAPQIVYHQPFHPSQTLPGAEIDPVLAQVGVNFVFHDDNHSGFEVSVAVQGSFNYSFIDPNKDDPNEIPSGRQAWQGQVQLQGAYAFVNLFGVDGLTLDLLVQAAGAASYQYDPTQRRKVTSGAGSIAGGFQISKSLGKDSPFSLGVQGTVGASTNKTVDWTGQVIFSWQYDFLPAPKK